MIADLQKLDKSRGILKHFWILKISEEFFETFEAEEDEPRTSLKIQNEVFKILTEILTEF